MHGYGYYKYADGKTYKGQFVNDKKDGYGIYCWVDGKKYSGWWLNGKQEGLGIYETPNNAVRYGIWQDGKRQAWYDDAQQNEIRQKFQTAKSNKNIKKEALQRMNFDKPADFDRRI